MKLLNIKCPYAVALRPRLSPVVQRLNIGAIFLAFLVSGCQPQQMGTYIPAGETPAQIVAGKFVGAEEVRAPFLVGFVDEDNNPYCTGILLKKNIVLTAAHCVFMHENYSVFFGLQPKQSKKIPVEQVEYMEPFMKPAKDIKGKETPQWDLALLRLSEEAPAGYLVSSLLGSSTLLKSGLRLIPMGYGMNHSADQTGAGVLREGRVEFDKKENNIEFSTKPQRDGGACNGDSGGPIFVKQSHSWVVAGILSRGRHEQDCQFGAIYSDLTSKPVKEWLKKSLEKLLPKDSK